MSVGIVDESQAIAEIVEGLKVGDRIVVGNVGTLGAGMKVTIAGESEGSRAGNREPGAGKARPQAP